MGITASQLHVLAAENKKHPVGGDVLTLGQQAIHCDLAEVKRIFAYHNIAAKTLGKNFDTGNKIPACAGTYRERFTNGYAVLSLLGAERVFVADITDHEGADYLIDLNYDVDERYREKFDVILDSGTIEHVFDARKALGNLVKMVKKGGRVILILPSSGTINHGFWAFHPNLFFDFFGANGFSEFSCYLIESSSFNPYLKSKVYRYEYSPNLEYPISSRNIVEVCFCATKNKDYNLTEIKKPIQNMYLMSDWGRNFKEGKSQRPEFLEKIIRGAEFYTRKFRPEFIDILWKSRRRRAPLTYLGKF